MSTIRKSKSYSFELKLNAVNRVQAGESVKIVAKQLEIVDPDYIYVWIKKYETYKNNKNGEYYWFEQWKSSLSLAVSIVQI